jgi:hypothetical protein
VPPIPFDIDMDLAGGKKCKTVIVNVKRVHAYGECKKVGTSGWNWMQIPNMQF